MKTIMGLWVVKSTGHFNLKKYAGVTNIKYIIALNLHDHNTYDGSFHNQRERHTRFKHNLLYTKHMVINQIF